MQFRWIYGELIIGSAISEASRPAEIKHAVRSKYDVKEN